MKQRPLGKDVGIPGAELRYQSVSNGYYAYVNGKLVCQIKGSRRTGWYVAGRNYGKRFQSRREAVETCIGPLELVARFRGLDG